MWPFFMTTKLGLLALRGNNCILLYKVTIKLLGMTNEKGKQGRIVYLNLGHVRYTVGKTVTKKNFWILDFTKFCCPSEFSGL